MYWAYTTMTTVGYGDISSITVAEKIWAIIVMIVSGFFFSFVVGRVAVVVARFDADQQAYDQQMEMVGGPAMLQPAVTEVSMPEMTHCVTDQALLPVAPCVMAKNLVPAGCSSADVNSQHAVPSSG
jgi:hypothetical protein